MAGGHRRHVELPLAATLSISWRGEFVLGAVARVAVIVVTATQVSSKPFGRSAWRTGVAARKATARATRLAAYRIVKKPPSVLVLPGTTGTSPGYQPRDSRHVFVAVSCHGSA